jgi:predicted nucleotidyltransferase
MVEEQVLNAVARYLDALPKVGVHPCRAVLFGSYARGEADADSDIDLVVIASELDPPRDIEIVERLWLATKYADDRIEPIACGEREWETEGGRPVLDIAREEGIFISAAAERT